MAATRALLARVERLEQVRAPRSPIIRWYGSLEIWEAKTMTQVEAGVLDRTDMVAVLACVRRWHRDGVFAQ